MFYEEITVRSLFLFFFFYFYYYKLFRFYIYKYIDICKGIILLEKVC